MDVPYSPLFSTVGLARDPTALPILLPCLTLDSQLSCPCCAQMQEERANLEQVQGDERSTGEADRACFGQPGNTRALSWSTAASLNISKVSRQKKGTS